MTAPSPKHPLLRSGGSLLRRAALLCSLALVASLFVLTPNAGAAPGDLDTSFGAGAGEPPGTVMTDFGGGAVGQAVALQPDGKIVVGGTANNGTDDFAVARYNPDGTLDSTFGTAGKVVTPLDPSTESFDVGTDVAVQPDGKIVQVGTTNPDPMVAGDLTGSTFGIVRYNPDGSLDTTFSTAGSDGIMMIDFGSGFAGAGAQAVEIAPDDKILVAGSALKDDDDQESAIARLDSTGVLDTDFDSDGLQTTGGPAPPINDSANDLVLQSDGRIVTVGSTTPTDPAGAPSQFYVVRYLDDGSLDPAFDADGHVETDFDALDPANSDMAESVALDDDGKIVVAGVSFRTDNDVALARYNATDGSLDSTFAGDGTLSEQLAGDSSAAGVAIQTDGAIVAAGGTVVGTDDAFGVWRFTPAGEPDTTFGGDGAVDTVVGPNNVSQGTGIVIQPDGNLVVSGGAAGENSFGAFAVARYLALASDLPMISVADVSLQEGTPGFAPPPDAQSGGPPGEVADVILTLSAVPTEEVTVEVTTVPGTAKTDDFFPLDGETVTFEPGQKTATIGVAIKPDLGKEPDETLLLNLSNPVNAVIGDAQAILTIVNDDAPGYWLVASDGGIFSYGSAPFLGSTGGLKLNKPVVGMTATVTGKGYWFVASDGGVFNYGDAGFFGSTGSMKLNEPVVGMAATPTGKGYWLVASDGGIFAFGDAQFYGSTGGTRLNLPVVGMAATPTGLGYWFVASDGGIFSYGDAGFFGSEGGKKLNQPVVGMASTASGKGYWFVAADGGIFSKGDAEFFGSEGGNKLNKPVVGMTRTPTGKGYWFVASDGGIFSKGDADFLGSTGSAILNQPMVGMAALGSNP